MGGTAAGCVYFLAAGKLTEESLQANHAGHKAIKVNGQLAAGVAGSDTVLDLVIQSEAYETGKPRISKQMCACVC